MVTRIMLGAFWGSCILLNELCLGAYIVDNLPVKVDGEVPYEESLWFPVSCKIKQDEYGFSDAEGACVVGMLFEEVRNDGSWDDLLLSGHGTSPRVVEAIARGSYKVVGDCRRLAFDDIPSLPAVRIVVKEVLRWRSATARRYQAWYPFTPLSGHNALDARQQLHQIRAQGVYHNSM
ncbi:MAG: hypothetical protein M1830_005453, partial [Pleopsidium flavum]